VAQLTVSSIKSDLTPNPKGGHIVRGIVRFSSSSGPQLGLLDDDRVWPLGLGDESLAEVVSELASVVRAPRAGVGLELDSLQLLPPVAAASRVFCVAQNYPAHAAEAGGASPPRPIVFMKPVSAFVGHRCAAVLPALSEFFDYEGEIAAVVGRETRGASHAEAMDAIAGYTLANDGSARDLQPAVLADRFQVDWFAAKSMDAGSALGPAIVPAWDLPGPELFEIETHHNGDLVQKDVGGSMYHSVADLVVFLSGILTLRAGDVILTGTPAGVGKARGVRLQRGDTIRVAVAGLGELENTYREGPVDQNDRGR
jgi:acylpyruvate hydrolase